MELHWPQWTFIVLITLRLLLSALVHDKKFEQKINFWKRCVGTGLLTSLLYCGGFFG